MDSQVVRQNAALIVVAVTTLILVLYFRQASGGAFTGGGVGVEGEAYANAKVFWEDRIIKCGDKNYVVLLSERNTYERGNFVDVDYFELTSYEIVTNPKCDQVTDVEKANKIECYGNTSLVSKMYRFYDYNKPAKSWGDYTNGLIKTVGFEKKDGKWAFFGKQTNSVVALSCEDIQKDMAAKIVPTVKSVLARSRPLRIPVQDVKK